MISADMVDVALGVEEGHPTIGGFKRGAVEGGRSALQEMEEKAQKVLETPAETKEMMMLKSQVARDPEELDKQGRDPSVYSKNLEGVSTEEPFNRSLFSVCFYSLWLIRLEVGCYYVLCSRSLFATPPSAIAYSHLPVARSVATPFPLSNPHALCSIHILSFCATTNRPRQYHSENGKPRPIQTRLPRSPNCRLSHRAQGNEIRV